MGVLITAAILVIVGWTVLFVFTLQQWPADSKSEQLARFGQIGDTFGSLNTLFSGLAIAGVVFTLYRQHQDGRDAEERHTRDLQAQRDSARVAFLASVVEYHRSNLERMDVRVGELRKLIGFQGYFHQQLVADARFGSVLVADRQ